MSRLAKKPIIIPQGVTAEIAGNKITVKGPESLQFQSVHLQAIQTILWICAQHWQIS